MNKNNVTISQDGKTAVLFSGNQAMANERIELNKEQVVSMLATAKADGKKRLVALLVFAANRMAH